jgi:2-polyprenyl-6-hydroxyphenyl methylase/3-demethylubiquinone-9 3-methyltransferase
MGTADAGAATTIYGGSSGLSLDGSVDCPILIGPSLTTGEIEIGGTSQTGTIYIAHGTEAQAVEIAKSHAAASHLPVTYESLAAEDLVRRKKTFDVVCALEILEHVSDPQTFVTLCAKLVRPGGLVIFSTLNRTWTSYALGIVAAEYVLGWVPKGTHDWKRFLRPSELARMAEKSGLTTACVSGLVFDPLSADFEVRSFDTDVNYFLVATKS